jgi:hypothetical protein
MIEARFRPIPIWPHDTTPHDARRSPWTFKASWQNTLDLLDRELRHLAATSIVIGCGLREQDIRQDGWPRSGARTPEHPGVEISFDGIPLTGKIGRLVYATDVCHRWEHNVRAIALGLEALRAVDRHGITRRGEQYAGFKALPTVTDGPTVDRGRVLVDEHGSVNAALRATHPDTGGSRVDFESVLVYREAA